MSLTSPDLMGEVRRLPYDGGLRLGFDIGGTQTCSLSSRGTYESYVSSQHPSVADIIALSILREGCRPGKIVLAPAGPRIDPGVVMMTNVKRWPLIVTAEIERQLGGGTRVCDVNDMAAKAAGHAMVASVSLIGPEALDQLDVLLGDAYPNARYNAAVALCRQGDLRAVPGVAVSGEGLAREVAPG